MVVTLVGYLMAAGQWIHAALVLDVVVGFVAGFSYRSYTIRNDPGSECNRVLRRQSP